MPDPKLVGLAGDWHANRRWAAYAIDKICAQLPEDGPRIILQLGDFGAYPEPELNLRGDPIPTYLELVWAMLELNHAELWFIDGNHEDHPYIESISDKDGWLSDFLPRRVRHLRRGTRWNWHGREWLALGGATSVDKNLRKAGVDWFPEEEITDAEERSVISMGKADVMLCHDAPTSEPLVLGVPPQEWLPMIPRAEEHRDRLERICKVVMPRWFIHGHYHTCREYVNYNASWGKCTFLALDRDGIDVGNWVVLDPKEMLWYWPDA